MDLSFAYLQLNIKGHCMYYAQKSINTGTVLNPVIIVEYWAFDSKQQRDLLVNSNPSSFPAYQKDIPDLNKLKQFSHFKDSFSGLFLIPISTKE